MKLTIGMATADDFHGVYFTIQALRMYHNCEDVEFIVVDNLPDSKASPLVHGLVTNWAKGRYIPMADMQGTTQPRNRVFQEATGDAVMCIDSHVLLAPRAIERLLKFYRQNPQCQDLLSGPMLYDNLHWPDGNTHFDDVWRSEMWGIWGKAFGCPCSRTHFTVLQSGTGTCDFRKLGMGLLPVEPCPHCGYKFPTQLGFAGHEKVLLSQGCTLLGADDDSPPFEIPGQGLGLFTCMKDAWLGFNPNFRQFGGEEMYIHTKYRQAGHKALCLPFLKWGHRFGRPDGTRYAITRWHKIRNYVLGHTELGLPLDRVYQHFVTELKLMPQSEWDYLIEDPIGHVEGPPPKNSPVQGCGSNFAQPRATIVHEHELLTWAKTLPRDLDQHLDKLAELAAKCQDVTEITHRRESTVALLQTPGKVKSFQAERDRLTQRLLDLYPAKLDVTLIQIEDKLPDIQPTEMLFLDTFGSAERLYKELMLYSPKVSKYIVMHDTALYGEQGEDGKPGMLVALRHFLKTFPKWSVIYHTQNQYGLTVISPLDSEKPKLPSIIKMAANFATASAAFVADGMKTVELPIYNQRLEICSICEHRVDSRCALCGCFLEDKAKWRVSECPIAKWLQGTSVEASASST